MLFMVSPFHFAGWAKRPLTEVFHSPPMPSKMAFVPVGLAMAFASITPPTIRVMTGMNSPITLLPFYILARSAYLTFG